MKKGAELPSCSRDRHTRIPLVRLPTIGAAVEWGVRSGPQWAPSCGRHDAAAHQRGERIKQ